MQRITMDDLKIKTRWIDDNIAIVSHAMRGRNFHTSHDIQRGSAVNGHAWSYTVRAEATDGTHLHNHRITANSARELHNKMEAFNDALRFMRFATERTE